MEPSPIVFASLAALFWFRLGSGDPSKIPSSAQTALPPLADSRAGDAT